MKPPLNAFYAFASVLLTASFASASTKCDNNPWSCTWTCNGVKYGPKKEVLWSQIYAIPPNSREVNLQSRLTRQRRNLRTGSHYLYECSQLAKGNSYRCDPKKDDLVSFTQPITNYDAIENIPIPSTILIRSNNGSTRKGYLETTKIRQENSLICYKEKDSEPNFVNANLYQFNNHKTKGTSIVELRFIDVIKKITWIKQLSEIAQTLYLYYSYNDIMISQQ